MNRLTQFVADDRGVDLIEYALLAGLVGIAAVGTLTTIGEKVSAIFGSIDTALVIPDAPAGE
jgi:pilus assembly protein Flp/PilA